jgi:hypothetical protein
MNVVIMMVIGADIGAHDIFLYKNWKKPLY